MTERHPVGMAGSNRIPSGLVAFVFTDVEGSTALWAADEGGMSASLAVHDEILRATVTDRGGYVFTTAGDSFAVAFSRVTDAVDAASAAQAALAAADWPGPPLRVRMGIHLGEAEERGGDYFGPVVNLTARLEAAGHGGQVLVSDAVKAAVDVTTTDLGIHQLRDVPEPIRIHQLGAGEFDPLRIVSPGRTNLPVSRSRVVGRDDAMQEVRQALLEARLVTLTAPGGTGKTRLAVAVGEAELLHRRNGVWFVDLSTVDDGAQVASTIAEAIGLQLGGGDATGQVVEYLSGLDTLVILDNCEHLVDACADVLEAVVGRPGASKVLATTREFFDIDGERAIRLPQLDAARVDSPAVELFLHVAEATNPHFSVAGDDLIAIRDLCGRLDGSPLAIKLAASRCNVMSPQELLAGIGERFELLRGGRRRRSRRALEDTLEWSYGLLDRDEQELFRVLGVFVGSFEIGAVAAVAQVDRAVALDLIDSLIAKSLVMGERAATGMRFRLLETTAAYAERCLDETGESSAARDRHADHFVAICEPHARTPFAVITPRAIIADRANIRAAVEWALLGQRCGDAVRLLFGAFDALSPQADDLLRLAGRCAENLVDPTPLELQQVRYVIVQAATLVDDMTMVGAVAAENLASSAPEDRIAGLWVRAWFEMVSGDAETAVLTADEIRAAAAAVADDATQLGIIGLSAGLRGWALANRGRFEDAVASYRELRALADHRSALLPVTLSSEGLAHIELGDPATAFALADRLDEYDVEFARAVDLRMFAHIACGDVEVVLPMIRAHAEDALTGRLSRMANDTLLIMVFLAEAVGDLETARRLLPEVELARTVQTIATSIALATRLGVGEECARRRQIGLGDRRASGRRAIEVLRAEVGSSGWLTSSPPLDGDGRGTTRSAAAPGA